MTGGYASAGSSLPQSKEKHVLVICDVQPDLLKAIAQHARDTLLQSLRVCIETARKAGWTIVFTGTRFAAGYAGVSSRHRIYGGFKRLNEKVGDAKVNWFLDGYAGSEIDPSLPRGHAEDAVFYRQQHLPSAELVAYIQANGFTKAFVAGIKAGFGVQAVCQMLCNEGLSVAVIRECVQDDKPERLLAVLDHLLPVYADVISREDFIEAAGVSVNDALASVSVSVLAGDGEDANGSTAGYYYCTDCKRGGHGSRYIQYLLERPGWRKYPEQKWYQDEMWKEYYCPLGKKVVDFADEPQFSKIAMYLKGREWIEDKLKILEIAADHMPETYFIEGGNWKGTAPKADDDMPKAPWFVKKVDSNWGTNVQCCQWASECIGLTLPQHRYVVQQHVAEPMLMDDGRKVHIKFYNLLVCEEDGVSWRLYTYKDGYLSISPNKWSCEDTSIQTQVTILRDVRISDAPDWNAWGDVYPKCQAVVKKVIGRAIEQEKLQGRRGQKQFEVFSADFIVDMKGDVWMFEFNTDPVLKDVKDSETVNDTAKVKAALSIVLPWEHGDHGLWDVAADYVGTSCS
eukprot:TRINITY_DN14659_c0_g1_i1.p1 TRINITY_DN14659_c0_g1~~TRINITY_DN14659_c0_g1_i1.p1  ORF type:complete len:569 (-),score=117.28 TRINITY_DN14659_c0_g1_i1:122-1828(-)